MNDPPDNKPLSLPPELLTRLIDMASTLIVVDDRGRVLVANEAAKKMLDRSADELLGRPLADFLELPETLGQGTISARVKASPEARRELKFEARPLIVGDSAYTVLAAEVPASDLQAALQASATLLNNFIDHSPLCIWIADAEGTCIRINEACSRMFGMGSDQVVGRYNIFRDSDLPRRGQMKEIRRVFEQGQPVRFVNQYDITHSGLPDVPPQPPKTLVSSIFPINSEDGSLIAAVVMHEDLTEQQQTQQALRENQRMLATLMSNLPGMAFRCLADEDWTMLFVSEGSIELIGMSPSDFTDGRRVSYEALIHPDDRAMVRGTIEKGLGDRQPYEVTYRLRRDGMEKWVWERGRGVWDDQGTLLFIEGFITNITELHRAQDELRASEERLALAMEASRTAFWDWDVVSGNVKMSPQLLAGLGHDEATEGSFEQWREFVHPDDLPAVMQRLDEHLQGDTPVYDAEYRVRAYGDQWRWVLNHGRVVERNHEGQPLRMVGTQTDVTARHRAEEAMQASEELYRKLMESAGDAIFVAEVDTGKLVDCNRQAQKLMGMSKDEILSLHQWQLHPPEDRPQVRQEFCEHANRLDRKAHDSQVVRKDGKRLWVSITANPFEVGDRRLVMGIFRDISERRESEQALRRQTDRLGSLLEATKQFNANLEVPVVLRSLVRSALKLIGASAGMAAVREGDKLAFREYVTPDQVRSLDPGETCGVAISVLADHEPYISNDAASDPNVDPETRRRIGFSSLLAAPILNRQGEIFGCVILHDGTEGGFDENDAGLLMGLCSMATAALENALLLEQTRRVERDLRASNEKFEAIIEFLPDATFVIDRDRKIIAWNRAMEEMSGQSKKEMIGQGDYAYAEPFYGDRRPVLVDLVEEDDGDVSLYDYVTRVGSRLFGEVYVSDVFDGRGAYLWLTASPLLDSEGNVIGAIESIRDITARRKAELALQDSEARLRRQHDALMELAGSDYLLKGEIEPAARQITIRVGEILSAARCSIWLLDEPGQHLHCLDHYDALEQSHSCPEPIDLDHCPRYAHSLQQERVIVADDTKAEPRLSEFLALCAHQQDVTSELDAPIRRSGRVVGLLRTEHAGKPRTWTADEQNFVASIADLLALTLEGAERRQAQQDLQHEKDFAESVITNAQAMVLVIDRDLNILRINRFGEQLTGYRQDEIVGKNIIDTLVSEPDRPRARSNAEYIFQGHVVRDEDNCLITREGREVVVRWYASPMFGVDGLSAGMIAIAHDMTELRQKEEQLRQAQKMEAVGRLAGGVAHDFNNQLTVVKGYADLLLRELGPEDPGRPLLSEIRNAALRAEGLTSQLLAFSRKQMLEPAVMNLNQVVEEMGNPLKRMIGEDIRLNVRAEPELDNVLADANQVKQVLVNLVINARDAMPDGGELTLETANVQLKRILHAQPLDVPPGRYVMLRLSDTGVGMSEEVLAQIFEPFFTTKPEGRGTGLGLAMVYGFVRQSGGYITVESEIDAGSTFSIYLPVVHKEVEIEPPPKSQDEQPGGTESVLISEDDPAVRELLVRILSDLGYTVRQTPDATEALKLLHDDKPVDLLITDVVMPGISGLELARKARELQPNLPIIYITGYADRAVASDSFLSERTRLLIKPFRTAVLADAIRELLEDRRSEP